MRTSAVISLVVALGGLAGCDLLWDATNTPGLKSDISELLWTAAVSPQQLECRMLGTSRAAVCDFNLTPKQAAAVTRTLVLQQIRPSDGLARIAGANCAVAEAAVFGIAGRPERLRTPSAAFEYFVLSYDPTSGRACAQVSYAYS